MKKAGLPFCYPAVSAADKAISTEQSFDLALAAKLLAEKKPVVRNGFELSGVERMIVVSGCASLVPAMDCVRER